MANMETNQPRLKGKNVWWLRLFIVVNSAIFLSVIIGKQLTMTSIDHFWQNLSAKDGLLALCFPLITIILNGVIGDLGKARLVFWRWRNPLPGCRAFSVIMQTDPRIDVARISTKLGSVPLEPKEQNAKWYHLYKTHVDKPIVIEAHRNYLLTRDITAIAALFVVVFSSGTFLSTIGWRLSVLYTVAILAQYLIVATSARNYGNRFVANVLVEESQV
ncbi:MAG: hypothetical protein JW768_11165 [Chitinispirillaceae bacterium]|nr:hypothetical protein [Chitinispirillaceae bacterium]